ncbi:MAG: DUF3810 domain-containing protein [Ginsengibacter sp.]
MQFTEYFKRKKWFWIISISLIVLIKLLAQYPSWIDYYYTKNFYRIISTIMRSLYGWIPFIFGDVLYFASGCWLLYAVVKNSFFLFSKKLTRGILYQKLLKLFYGVIVIYIAFNILWGLNYDSVPPARKLGLKRVDYDTSELVSIQGILLRKVNEKKQALVDHQTVYPADHDLFTRAELCYDSAAKVYSFIQYKNRSLKSSFYGSWGNYLGFTGYYNPFSGEAQVNTTVPKFLLPYVATHEIAHQIGFAKENEANFIGYLAAVNSGDTLFQYSAYLDLFLYANREVYFFDSTLSKKSIALLIPPVRADVAEWKKFNLEHTSFIEPVISWMYGKYLQMNRQPEGLRSYSEVISTLIAYYRKYGKI